ncbi:MAG: FAD-dependent oxidoreductase, partial [Lentisphaerae bacterium]|nr:FAD-dependent oxidoreductase [Lentisphaerota bacterium]
MPSAARSTGRPRASSGTRAGLVSLAFALAVLTLRADSLLIEAEAFADRGGWVLDTQFCDTMGSPYLLAHGLGTPVADAVTTVTLPRAGVWRLWVRTRDWTPDAAGDKPGRFQIALNGASLSTFFGIAPAAWGWADGGAVDLASTSLEIRLRDLTGFDGRCDALFLTTDTAAAPPPDGGTALAQWRAQMRGETAAPETTAAFDLVVVGGGFGGCGAALAAARSGLRVALVQDRPV